MLGTRIHSTLEALQQYMRQMAGLRWHVYMRSWHRI